LTTEQLRVIKDDLRPIEDEIDSVTAQLKSAADLTGGP
jgi:hypothetical protein